MNTQAPANPVVVGIDGSKHARRAARWAALEAASRDTTLRLVYVIDSEAPDGQKSIHRAQHALHKAWKAVAGTHIDVKLESADFCTCVFRGLKETVNFDEMKEFEEAQAEAEPGELTIPKNIDKVRSRCAEDDTSYE